MRDLEAFRRISPEGYKVLLNHDITDSEAEMLQAAARRRADMIFGRNVRVRGLIEITNECRNNCYYCGLRRDNRSLERYTLDSGQIMECCRRGYEAGLRTFVLQGGENPSMTVAKVEQLVADIHGAFPDAAITLSLGEWSDIAYRRFFDAGATRYLLRHETRNRVHYSLLHPSDMSQDNRLRCLTTLKRIGYQTGTGIMVGAPGQTLDHVVEDLMFMEELQPEMIGIGPFIPHSATPLAGCSAGSVDLTLRLISILRLMFPGANIPSTTALATLSPDGRKKGILAGANVVMPNLSPMDVREQYSLYDNKAHSGKEAVEGLAALNEELSTIGFCLTTEKGDFKNV